MAKVDVRAELESLGWQMIFECTACSGLRQEFTNDIYPKYIVKLWPSISPNHGSFFNIYLENHAISSRFWGYQLREQLQKFKLL